jgi:hypothetical protein
VKVSGESLMDPGGSPDVPGEGVSTGGHGGQARGKKLRWQDERHASAGYLGRTDHRRRHRGGRHSGRTPLVFPAGKAIRRLAERLAYEDSSVRGYPR